MKSLSLFGAGGVHWAGNQRGRSKHFILGCLLCLSLFLSTTVLAHAYSSILSFGDSLSDDGGVSSNYQFGVQGVQDNGVTVGPFTNGTVWVTDLSAKLNIPLLDMAYGGASSGFYNPWAISNGHTQYDNTGILSQVNTYLTNFANKASGFTQAPQTTLVTMLAGANDFLFNPMGQPYAFDATTAADNVKAAVISLAQSGFKNFLVPNLPDIPQTPLFQSLGESPATIQAQEDWVTGFNKELLTDLATLKSTYPGDNFYTLDTYDYLDELAAQAYAQNGIDGVKALFWVDGLHPSAATHQLFADYAAGSVPEPSTLLLLILGFAGIGICTPGKKAKV